MARQARIKYEFGVFHIEQHGGGCRKLFKDHEDREKFLAILMATQKKFNFLLYGFCLEDDDNYDLIIDVNGGDLSKIMKSINIAYAMYARCNGKLFSDRYKSTFLETDEMIDESKKSIQGKKTNFNKDDPYNMCYEKSEMELGALLDFEDCNNCINCMTTAKSKLIAIAGSKGVSAEALIADKDMRNELICKFRKGSTLSLVSLGELFGGLSESSISKILKNSQE